MSITLENASYAVGIIAAAIPILRVIYKWAKRLDDGMATVDAFKTNHLPHIEHFLRAICVKLDIPYTDMEGFHETHKDGHERRNRTHKTKE